MESLLSKIANIIEKRRSIRTFDPHALSKENEELLRTFIVNFKAPFEHKVQTAIYQKFTEKPVFYLFKEPPFFFHICGSKDILDQAKIGFIGEVFLLYANSLGISTCWYGHFREKNVIQIVYADNKKFSEDMLHCISPLGYLADKQSFLSNMTVKKFTPKKTIEENLLPESIKEIPDSIKNALLLACNSPSAMNSQPWTFLVKDSALEYSIIITKPVGFRVLKWPYPNVDVGTAAAHFWLGVKAQNIPFTLNLSSEKDCAVWHFLIKKTDIH